MGSDSDKKQTSIGRPENFGVSIISVTVVPCLDTPSSHRWFM